MNTQAHKVALTLLLSSGFLSTQAGWFADDVFEQMDQLERRMRKELKRMNKQMHKQMNSLASDEDQAKLLVNDLINEQKVVIEFKPLKLTAPTFDADLDADTNTLTVNTPVGKIILQVHKNLLNIGYSQQISEQSDREGAAAQFISNSHSQSTRTIGGNVALDQVRIEYESEQKVLRIELPYQKKNMTKIPVMVKEVKETVQEK